MATEDYLKLISGETKGAVASCSRAGLHLLSYGYALGVSVRNRLFNSGLKSIVAPEVPAVAVGNITTGGTGKTPVVAYLTNWFSERGITPAILSRGYRSLESGENDEKLVLDRLCEGVSHWQNPDRVASAQRAVARGAEVLILDDAFQHRRIGRDLNLCLIDATNPWGYGYLLPRGLLRESRRELRRADSIVLTRTDQISQAALDVLISEIQHEVVDTPIVLSKFTPTGFRTLQGESLTIEECQNQSTIAFCAIGNPDGFRRSLELCGCSCDQLVLFPDHHHYTVADSRELTKIAADRNCSLLFTTLKDLVKLPADVFAELTVAALDITFEIVEEGKNFHTRLEQVADSIRNLQGQR